MTLDTYCNTSASDRFNGEIKDPPKWKRCEHCNKWIYVGDKYMDSDSGLYCLACADIYEIEGTIQYARADKE